MRGYHRDALFVAGLVLLTALCALRCVDFSAHPQEDAAILMRYSQHVAQGHGIVWNIGEKPVDGATDFLFMMLIAGLIKAGLALEASVRLVCLGSHLLTVLVVYAAIRRLYQDSQWIALVTASCLAVGPGLGYVEAYFGTPFFALSAAITWFLANEVLRRGPSPALSWSFAASALIMGLIRPEGVLLAVFMLCAIAYAGGLKASRAVVLPFLTTFAVLGGLYFLWRWHHFGYPLPNPYYKKGQGVLHPGSLLRAVRNVAILSFPFSLALIIGFRTGKVVRRTIFSLIPIAGFTAIWALISDETDYLRRFQYPLVPIIMISWPSWIEGIRDDWRLPRLADIGMRNRVVLVLFLAMLSAGTFLYERRTALVGAQEGKDGRYDVAVALSAYNPKNYIIATSEAGLVPLYSGWRAVDTWGLNDPWIAHHGGVTKAYLDRYRPQIILFHAFFSPLVAPRAGEQEGGAPGWGKMVQVLKEYAEENRYHLAAAFGCTPFETQYYYVRRDFLESAEIVKKIQAVDYGTWWFNYAR